MFGSADSKVKSDDQIGKLIRLVTRARSSQVLLQLQAMQLHDGEVTWAGKWSLVVRLLGIANDSRQFAFLVRTLSDGFKPNHTQCFKDPVPDLNKQTLVDAGKAIVFTHEIMQKIVEDCTLVSDGGNGSDAWNKRMEEFLTSVPSREVNVFGVSDTQLGVLKLLDDLEPWIAHRQSSTGGVACAKNASPGQRQAPEVDAHSPCERAQCQLCSENGRSQASRACEPDRESAAGQQPHKTCLTFIVLVD